MSQEHPVSMKCQAVTLSPVESLFKKLLIDCRNHNRIHRSQWFEPASSLELRFTGGWVRDKLLGLDSHDIDVALSSMTGEQFGLMLQAYVNANASEYEAEARRLETRTIFKDLHRIKKNPEKSKHLETMTTTIFGLEVDFVNLRKETYSEDSRNPEIEFGTPEEDATRRDATINAMFYNLDMESTVEDFTGKGLEDLKKGIIRTPLPPYETFIDDPLRVLRLIRFASKYGYDIEKESAACMQDPKIHQALLRKITRDRVGVEVEKMFTGPKPHIAISYLKAFGLFPVVFQESVSDSVNLEHLQRVFDTLTSLINSDQDSLMKMLVTKDDIPYAWYLSAFIPWYDSTSDETVQSFRDAIKASNKVTDRVKNAMKYREEVGSLVNAKDLDELPRSTIGLALRRWGATWRLTILYTMLSGIYSSPGSENEIAERYHRFLSIIKRMDLEDADRVLPIINGDRMQKEFGLKKGGRWVGKALEMVVMWQFDNPNGRVEELLVLLKERKSEFGVPDPDE